MPPTREVPPQRNLVPILAVLTAILFVTTVVFGLMALAPSSAPIKTGATKRAAQADTEAEIQNVATRFTQNLVTFNYATLDQNIERVMNDASGNFANQFHAALGGNVDTFRNAIKRAKAQSVGEIKTVSVTSRDDDTATALIFISQTVRNAKRPEPRTQLHVLELSLVKTANGWKVDNVGNPSRPTG